VLNGDGWEEDSVIVRFHDLNPHLHTVYYCRGYEKVFTRWGDHDQSSTPVELENKNIVEDNFFKP
jgi:hypothetical protein